MFKIIDENGRLFGKINIVDFLIIILILIVMPTFLHIHEILSKRPTRVPHTWIKVEAVTFTLPEIAKLFKPGDVSHDEYGNVDGRLLRILKRDQSYSNRLKRATINQSHETRYEHRIPVFLELELSCTLSAEGESWYYRRNSLYITLDYNFEFITDKYIIKCYALKIEG